jgi:myo-inositol-1(or 4)-monophosphatase
MPMLNTMDAPQPDLGIGAGGDPLRRADLAAEKAIVETLDRKGVSFTLISEESGVREYGQNASDCYVTVDPIDGTTNLLRRIPFYATSIAVSDRPFLNSVHAALVADLFHGTTYKAERLRGSFREGHRISPSDNTSLEEAVIGLDLNSYKIDAIIPRLNELVKRTKHIRHFGANALELCFVADGKTDGFVDIRGKLRTTDIAGASLILREAGGLMTMPTGEALDARLDPKQTVQFVASANSSIHNIILGLIRSGKTE